MAKDIVKEALEQVENLKEASMANAKNVLVSAMSTDLKAAVTQALHESINESDDQPADYHDGKKDKNLGSDRVGDEIPADGDTPNDDPADKGDGPAIIETGIEEMDDDLEELPFEDDEEEEVEEMDMFEMDDEDFEDDEEEDVIEVVEDEGMDFEDDDCGDEEEIDVEENAVQYESTIKKLTAENKRMKNALGKVKVQMDEINLFNARLAAASDLMRRVTMTKDQKERVVENMDRCRSIGEVKRAHRMIYEGYKSKKVVKRNRVARPNVQSVVTEESGETNNKFARLNELAGL
jgi:hypothetical protein